MTKPLGTHGEETMPAKRLWVFIAAAAFVGCHRSAETTIDVRRYGAKGDGRTDDAPAIRRAIGELKQRGGGVLHLPAGTYLLDSYEPTSHPWFYYNLLISSHTHIQGEPGARLLQGPHGRAPGPAGAEQVRNTVLAIGEDYTSTPFQDPSKNGGFFGLQPTVAGGMTVTLARLEDSARFAPGGYVAIYAATTGDVIPTETGRLAAVEGVKLTLVEPLARGFDSPSIANVSHLATVDVSLRGIVIEGTEPFAASDTFGLVVED